jgi:competence protein ComEA
MVADSLDEVRGDPFSVMQAMRFRAMTHPPGNDRSGWPRLVLRRADQAAAAAVTAASLVAIAAWWLWQGQLSSRLIDIERAEPVAIDFKIDVNTADWVELTLMPGIGPELARRIVADRDAKGPFRQTNDLRRVRGIGPKTLDGMKPYLLPLSELDATAGKDDGASKPAAVN